MRYCERRNKVVSRTKKILVVVFIVFIAIQFKRPDRNISKAQREDLERHFHTPQNVLLILKASCYDCHSNNTNYPWYAQIQPFGWLLSKHITEGKQELNFSEFSNYSRRRQLSKLKAIQYSIKDGSMPLPSYTLLHSDAQLSRDSKAMLIQWTTKLIDSLSRSRE